MNIPIPHPLWKTPVEKIVENVENYELSTVIPFLSPWGGSCGKVCISPCIIRQKISHRACYVTVGYKSAFAKTAPKSLHIVKIRCHFLFPFHTPPQIFVKNPQRSFPVSSSPRWEYFSYPISTGGTPCREKYRSAV